MGFVSGGVVDSAKGGDGWRIGGGEVRKVVEGMVGKIWREVKGEDVLGEDGRFRVMRYKEAMERFGSDKPDLRFGLEVSLIELAPFYEHAKSRRKGRREGS